MQTRLNNISRELPFTWLKLVKTASAAIHWFPGFLPSMLKSVQVCSYFSMSGKKKSLLLYYFYVSLYHWRVGNLKMTIFFSFSHFSSCFHSSLWGYICSIKFCYHVLLLLNQWFLFPFKMINFFKHYCPWKIICSMSVLPVSSALFLPYCAFLFLFFLNFFFPSTSLSILIALVTYCNQYTTIIHYYSPIRHQQHSKSFILPFLFLLLVTSEGMAS